MGPGVEGGGATPQVSLPPVPKQLEGMAEPPPPAWLDDPTANIGGGAPADAVDAFEHWTDGPPLLAFGPDAGVPTAQPAPTTTPTPAPPAPTTDPAAPAPTTTDPAPAPAPPAGKGTHGSQTAKMKDVEAKDAKLDIDWIDDKDLNAHVRESIDEDFGDAKADKKVEAKIKKDAGLKTLEKESKATLDKARDEAAGRLGLKKGKKGYSKADLATIEKDAKFVEEQAAQKQKRAEAEAKIRADHDAAVSSGKREQSVDNPDSKTIERKTGKNLARTNFMSWAMYLMGDADKVKKHFKSIDGVKGDKNMLLAKKPRDRFEAARTQFEKENPGFTLPTTGVSHSMRDLHEKRNGLGMLGHALGLAVDYHAYDNPNLKGSKDEQPGLNAYMIKKFGGGRAQMSIDEDAIEQVGKNTAAGKPGANDDKVVAEVEKQFNELAQSSEDFKKALKPDQMAALQAGRNAHFDLGEKKAALAKLEKSLKSAKPADKDKLRKEKEALLLETSKLETKVVAGLEAFNPWHTTLTNENNVDNLTKQSNTLLADSIGSDLKGFKKLTDEQEDALAKRYGLGARSAFDPKNKKTKHKTYEAQLKAELEAKQKGAKDTAKYAGDAMAVRTGLMKKLRDPSKVFGQGEKQGDGTWKTKQKVSEVAVMQLLENGFVRDDAMMGPNPKSGKQAVFNGKAVAMLARHGFAPGSNFGDTMHFDFVEGYSDAVKGGRHGDNMKKTKFSPEGDYIEPPKKTKTKAKTK